MYKCMRQESSGPSALSLYRRANNVSFRMLLDYLGNSPGLRHQIAEHVEQQRLRPVAQRAFGVRMYVDKQSVSSGGHRRASHRYYGFAIASAVAGIEDDRQVRQPLGRGDD